MKSNIVGFRRCNELPCLLLGSLGLIQSGGHIVTGCEFVANAGIVQLQFFCRNGAGWRLNKDLVVLSRIYMLHDTLCDLGSGVPRACLRLLITLKFLQTKCIPAMVHFAGLRFVIHHKLFVHMSWCRVELQFYRKAKSIWVIMKRRGIDQRFYLQLFK